MGQRAQGRGHRADDGEGEGGLYAVLHAVHYTIFAAFRVLKLISAFILPCLELAVAPHRLGLDNLPVPCGGFAAQSHYQANQPVTK